MRFAQAKWSSDTPCSFHGVDDDERGCAVKDVITKFGDEFTQMGKRRQSRSENFRSRGLCEQQLLGALARRSKLGLSSMTANAQGCRLTALGAKMARSMR